jgi:hypothetical protein
MHLRYFIVYLLVLCIIISYWEWVVHYLQHHFSYIKKIFKYYKIKYHDHLIHHKETNLNQTIPDNFSTISIAFNVFECSVNIFIFLMMLTVSIFWVYFPNFKKYFSYFFTMGISFILLNIYLWILSSFHSHNHNRYIKCNVSNDLNPVYSPLSYFIPNDKSRIYKYCFWFHTLHHLNKGKFKKNFNVIIPLFDCIFGSYTDHVDNTKYFSKRKPKTDQEKWLKEHTIFEIRVLDDNKLEYKDKNTTEWKEFPENF